MPRVCAQGQSWGGGKRQDLTLVPVPNGEEWRRRRWRLGQARRRAQREVPDPAERDRFGARSDIEGTLFPGAPKYAADKTVTARLVSGKRRDISFRLPPLFSRVDP